MANTGSALLIRARARFCRATGHRSVIVEECQNLGAAQGLALDTRC